MNMQINSDAVRIASNMCNNDRTTIYWYVGDKCNYRCSYCHPSFYSGKYKWHSKEVVLRTLALFKDPAVIFSGGEPTYHPELFEIIEESAPGVGIGMISNGSRELDYWHQLMNLSKRPGVALSYHYEQVDFKHFIDVINVIQQYGQAVTVEFLMPPGEGWQQSVNHYNELKPLCNVNPKLMFEPIDQFSGRGESGLDLDPKYSPDQLEWFSNHTISGSISLYDAQGIPVQSGFSSRQLITSGITDFRGWDCYAASQACVVNADGNINTGLCSQRISMGNVFTGITFPDQAYHTCHTEKCTGWIDMHVTKIKRN